MLKRYVKLALLLFLPVLLMILIRMNNIQNSPHEGAATATAEIRVTSLSSIEIPNTPDFSIVFDSTVRVIYLIAAFLSSFIFTELRSQKTGGFIVSLPVKKSSIYNYIFIAGFLFITISYLSIFVLFYRYSEKILVSVLDIYVRNGWAKEGLKMTTTARLDTINSLTSSYLTALCMFSIFTFVQTLFQKVYAAIAALVGGMLGCYLFLMTIDKYFIVLQLTELDKWMQTKSPAHIIRYLWYGGNTEIIQKNNVIIFLLMTTIAYIWGKYLFLKAERDADFIFAFPAVKILMLIGAALSSGSLAVYLLFTAVGMNGLTLGSLNLFFVSASLFAWVVTRKLFKVIC